MTWHLYAVAALVIAVLAVTAGAVALIGLDEFMLRGLAVGGVLGLAMLAFASFSTRKAMGEVSKAAMLGHMYGGFGLRLVVLVTGFFALAFSGWGNPAGFALAFLAGVVISLGWNVVRYARGLKPAPQAAQAV